jgi:hypothetical protein
MRNRRLDWPALAPAALALALTASAAEPVVQRRLDGLNVIMAAGHPFGESSARRALADAKRLGARAVAIIPFLWQPTPASPDLVRGNDMPDTVLRAAIRDAHGVGLAVTVKPHVWVPGSWAGAIAMESEEAWGRWFANYRRELERIADLAQEERADALAAGTELAATSQRGEWSALIAALRARYSGTLLYVAHNAEEAEAVSFWDKLDLIGASLYPPLGADQDRAARLAAMRVQADRLDALAAKAGKAMVIAEIGLRSAQGAAARPWESPEERVSAPDGLLQAAVLADWLDVLDRPTVRGVLVWCWFSDPNAGGLADTDFTVQGKPAEAVLRCAWTGVCAKR